MRPVQEAGASRGLQTRSALKSRVARWVRSPDRSPCKHFQSDGPAGGAGSKLRVARAAGCGEFHLWG